MKKILTVLFLLVMVFTFVAPFALAEETAPAADEAVIGGADEATAILVTEETEAAETTEATDEKPLTLGESAMFMLKGMVGIFLVTGMIILVLVIMDKAGNRKKETEE